MQKIRFITYKLGIFITSFILCFLGILPTLHAQCDFMTSSPVIINQTGTPYAGGTTIYCLVNNANGNVVATSANAPANFGTQPKGAYTAYAINYVGATPTGITIGATFNPAGTCLSTSKHLVTVCNETPALNVCVGDELKVISNPDFEGRANMVYVLVYNADGKIKAFSNNAPSASFPTTSLATGAYTVYAVNYSSPATSALANVAVGNDWSAVTFAAGCHTIASAPASVNAIPSVPNPLQKSIYCNGNIKLEVPTSSIPAGQEVEWYNNNTHTGTAHSNPYTVSTGSTYYAFLKVIGSDCYGLPDSILVAPINVNPNIPLTDGVARYANYECLDASGWTHYGFDPDGPNTGMTAFVPNGDGDELLLFSIRKSGINIGTVGDGTFKVLLDGVAGAPAASGASHIPKLYPTNYCQATNWYVMNRYWDVTPNGTGQAGQIAGNVDIRFYFTEDDTAAIGANVPNIGGVTHIYFYKINGSYPINPTPGSNHGSIPLASAYNGNGYQQYSYGGTGTNTWALGNVSLGKFYAEYTVGSFSGGGGGASSFFGALPVELLSFVGTTNNEHNFLSWETLKEVNFSHFDLMRASENSEYAKIGKVEGKGTNGGGGKYAYTDKYPFTGINYYQLHLFDKDGEMSPSNIVELMVSPTFSYSIYPNPAKDELSITFNGANDEIGFSLYNAIGQEVANYVWTENINSLHKLNIASLASGAYFYKIKDGEKTYKGKFVKE